MAVRKLLTDGVYVDVGCGGGSARGRAWRAAAAAGLRPKRFARLAGLRRNV